MIDYMKAAVGRIRPTGEPDDNALPLFIFNRAKQQYWFVTGKKDRDGDWWVEARPKTRFHPEDDPNCLKATSFQFQLVSDADHPNQVAIYCVGKHAYLFVSSQRKAGDRTIQVKPPGRPQPRSWFILEPVGDDMVRFKSTYYNDRWLFSSADDDSGDDYVEAHLQNKVDGREEHYLLPVGLETEVIAETPKYGSFTEVPSAVDFFIRSSVRNEGSTPVTRKMELTKTEVTSFTLHLSESFRFGATCKVSAGIPGIGQASAETNWEMNFQADQSQTSAVTVNYGVSEEVQVAPFTEKHGTGTLKWSEGVKTPFTMNLRVRGHCRLPDGHTFPASGDFLWGWLQAENQGVTLKKVDSDAHSVTVEVNGTVTGKVGLEFQTTYTDIPLRG